MKAAVTAIEYHLPAHVLTNEDLAAEFPDWTVAKIEAKTGISQRPIASAEECSSDLGVAACEKLFASGACSPEEIDYLILCTQSPDYFLPTTACLVQDRLGIPKTAGALDINLGCSGYVYGLGLAKGLIETGQARRVLLVTAETYSKFIHPGDKSVRTLFGDAAAATLVDGVGSEDELIGPFDYGTDGAGGCNLIVPTGGLRTPRGEGTSTATRDEHGNVRSREHLYMNGSEIFAFTLLSVPRSISALLEKSERNLDDIDLFVFHQANRFMLDALRKKIGIPSERFLVAYSEFGNTVSSTIPIVLKEGLKEGRLHSGQLVMLVGFGVGYSWGSALLQWQ